MLGRRFRFCVRKWSVVVCCRVKNALNCGRGDLVVTVRLRGCFGGRRPDAAEEIVRDARHASEIIKELAALEIV